MANTIELMQADLLAARKTKDKLVTSTLQSMLARITNAEALPAQDTAYTVNVGVGSSEAPRRKLTEDDIRQLIRDEIAEIEDAMSSMDESHSYATELKTKASLLARYLG